MMYYWVIFCEIGIVEWIGIEGKLQCMVTNGDDMSSPKQMV